MILVHGWPITLIHSYLLDNWGSRYNIVLPESTDTWKSLVRWPIFSRMNHHCWAILGGDFALNIPQIAVLGYTKASKYLMNIISANWDDGGAVYTLLLSQTVWNTYTGFTLLTTVKCPINAMPSWCGFWPGKVWFWSTNPIQRPISLIHSHLMDTWGSRYKIVLSKTTDTRTSLMRWLIVSRMDDNLWANLGGGVAMNTLTLYIAVWSYA